MLFEWPKCQRGKTKDLVSTERRSDRKSHRKDRCIGLSGVYHFWTPLHFAINFGERFRNPNQACQSEDMKFFCKKMWEWRFPCLKIMIVIEITVAQVSHWRKRGVAKPFGGGGGLWRWQVTVCDIVTQCDSVALCDNSGVTTWSQSEEQQRRQDDEGGDFVSSPCPCCLRWAIRRCVDLYWLANLIRD